MIGISIVIETETGAIIPLYEECADIIDEGYGSGISTGKSGEGIISVVKHDPRAFRVCISEVHDFISAWCFHMVLSFPCFYGLSYLLMPCTLI